MDEPQNSAYNKTVSMANHSHHMTMRSATTEWGEVRSIITQSFVELATDSVGIMTDSLLMTVNDTNGTIMGGGATAVVIAGAAAITTSTPPINGEEVSYKGYQYRPETYIVPIIFGIIFLAGLMGNGMLIAVFVKHRAMRNVPNT